ncbi:uncharacterized protein FOMMEDRAFT_107991 [Fomitiporia mediterranea MF3/22]|uniref:uncharacterized protein n=1 Tax=Fomitiporia mediterranea (strain MF3/22) TaxID=694068 RepID=UPI0004408401|nr:uncharacterized protein FOMMEDRAFT_107991 [Fomitiporia mediterranea MF3/22]EJD02952.1 hypothetical protein FOMMEDRAFT_107991 [Fomitiporia mediterranea MF3/22]
MKISHKPKKFLAPHPQVAALIADILATPTNGLSELLAPIDAWKWPRSDLNAWIKVLNKFDAVLEDVIREYDIDGLQVKPFTRETKEIICEVLKFERLLLENSTNRKMFNSYDRLNSLLFSSDLDVLVATLLLLLRPSQQYSSQPALSHSLHISTSRLESLAKTSPMLREHAIEMIDLVSTKGGKRLRDLPQEASEVNFTFYSRDASSSEKPKESEDSGIFESSSRPQPAAQSSAPHTVHLGPLAQSSRSAIEIFADAVKSHQVPDSERYELLCRVRFAQALGAGREEIRQKLVIARLLAIAVYAHTHSETQAQSSLFLYDTDLVNRIAELLQQDHEVPVMVQMAALSALDALARYRQRVSEVLGAVNAGVNHGILMSLFRKTVADISNIESTLPNLFVDALVSFITFIASHAGGGNLVVGAGLVPILIQIIGITHEQRLPIVSKSMQLVDNVLYGVMNAFTLFCNSRGVEVLTERIKYEVDLAVEAYGFHEFAYSASTPHSLGLMHTTRAGVLKHLLRSIHRMMQASGTTEGMRGLIDSSLLKSVQNIIEYRGVFGPTVLPIAINVVATFVHNEPTSLTAIQEAKLPETILKAFEAGIEPSFEVVQSIPNALGALCLNQAGQDHLALHPSIIPALFSIFTSEAHLKVLLEKENAVSIGSSIDELVRHHPSLRQIVFDSLISTLKKIEVMGTNYVPPCDIQQFYSLSLSTEQLPSASEDVVMEDAQVVPPPSDGAASAAPNENGPDQGDESQTKSHDNVIINYIDVIGRFLEGLFQHPSHCRDFILATEGLACIARLLALPCLPYDYANAVHSDSLVQVIRTMVEVAPADTLTHLAQQVSESLNETKGFWQSTNGESKLLPYVEMEDEEEFSRANAFFHKLITLHVRITLLSDVYSTAGYTHGRHAVGLLQNTTVDIIPDLGALHRSCIWENIVLKNGLAAKGIASSITPSSSTEDAASTSPAATSTTQPDGQPPAESPSKDGQKKTEGPKDRNAVALKHIASQIPNALGPFFQAVAKMLLYNRRNPDEAQKKQAASISATLADVMYKHLTEVTDGNPTFLYGYHTVMIGLITFLLFDERASQTNYHAVLLLQFRKVGGLDAVLDTCRRYTSAISRISEIRAADRSESDQQELVHVFGGLKMALHLLYLMISFKPAIDPGQIAQYISKDKPENHPDFYEPHDFLVKMRLQIAPLIRDIWQSTWLVSAPPAVSKYVIQCVQEITSGENEVARPDFGSEILPSSGQGLLRPSQPPDEDRIRQLTDMGFPRAAAVRALSRTNNNVNFATEYLLTHPFEPVPEEPPAAVPPAAETTAQEPATDEAPADVAMETEPVPEEQPVQETAIEEDYESQKTVEERRQDLDEIRKSLISDIGPQALRLADAHPSLIFDVRHVFIGPNDKYQPEAIRCVVQDIEKFSPAAYDVQEEPLAVRCRLLALILADSPKAALEISGKEEKNLMDMLYALLLSQPIAHDKDQALPKWLPALLLAMESLLVTAEEPRAVPMVLADQPVVIPPLVVGPPYVEARSMLFELCIRLLHIPSLPRDELLATLRMLVQLTRDRNMADQFVRRNGVSLLLQRLKGPAGDASVAGFQSHIAIILRHLVEDRLVLETVMKQEIKRWLSTSRSKTVEVLTYVRNSTSMAARDPQVFLDITKELCTLVRPDVPNHQITLKASVAEAPPDSAATEKPPTEDSTSMQVDSPKSSAPPVSSEALESVVHFMLGELMRVGKLASEGIAAETSKDRASVTSPTAVTAQSTSSEVKDTSTSTTEQTASSSQKTDEAQKTQDAHFYACFLMQSLSELLFSYEQCKFAFLTYPKKKNQTPAKDAFSRSKSSALSFLLTELLSFGPFNVDPKFDSKKRVILCNWAMSVIVALCVDSSASHETQENAPDVTSIRKLVLESISRSFKDILATEPMDVRYGRILAMADLCHRLLSVRFGTGSTRSTEETPMHLAKIMLEKNFVSTLTTVLAEVDLNYPNMRSLVAAILRPLEYLTKVAIKMGRSDKNKEDSDKKSLTQSSEPSDDSDDSGEDDDDVMETEEREETPDLYRNSSLGMYAGEMEEHYDEGDEDEMDEDEDEEEDDVDVDYDEESVSEDSSNTEPEEGAEEHAIIDDSPEGWVDMDEEMAEGMDDMDEDEDEGDELEEEEGADEEIMWQPPENAMGDPDSGLMIEEADEDDLDDDAGMVDGDGQGGDEDDEDEMLSATDGLVGELGELEHTDAFGQSIDDPLGLGRPTMRVGSRLFFGGPASAQGRDLDADVQIIGRPRYTGISAEAMSHPLLVDSSSSGNVAGVPARSAQNRRARGGGILPSNPYSEVIQTIEELVGGGALQLVQELMTRNGIGGALGADIRVEVPHGAGGLLVDRTQMTRQGGRTSISTSVRLRDPRSADSRTDTPEFGPLQTIQRWSEEAKITHGKHLQERVQRLCNHIVLALLPDAREAAKKAKEKEEKEKAERETAEKEAAEKAAKEAEEKAAKEAEEKAEKEAEEKAAAEKEAAEKAAAEREAAERAAASSDVAYDALTSEGRTDGEHLPADEDTEMVDATAATENAAQEAEAVVQSEPEAGPSAAPERVTITINGNEVDITDTGIDPTFLEALPDDMREEVLNQHLREQRPTQVAPPVESQISADFLDALPPEIRAEILREERLERSRREREQNGEEQTAVPAGGPTDMGAADFIASLDPQLRQVVLLDSDDGILQTLPSHMVAEAGVYRETAHLHHRNPRPAAPGDTATSVTRKVPTPRDAIQLLERPGIAALVRLLFFPQLSKKSTLHKVLLNLCENSKSRTELFNVLLSILQDGTGDLALVDKSFSQLTFRGGKGPAHPTSKSIGKQKDPGLSIASPIVPSEVPPDLIAQRCLDALNYIVGTNELSSLFFLTEHELSAGLKRSISKKGKGKEKQAAQSHYPIVLLLGLLDRQTLLKTPSIMDSVAGLLDSVTRPLTSLKDDLKKKEDAGERPSAPAESSAQQDTSGTAPPTTANEPSGSTAESSTAQPAETSGNKSSSVEAVEEKILLANPPQIPHPALRSIVNILTVGECSGRTFQHTLALIQHLSFLPDARDIIAQELRLKANDFGANLSKDLDELITALSSGQTQEDLPPSIVAKFSPASSDQAKFLRVLKTIDYMYSKPENASSRNPDLSQVDRIREIYETFRFTLLWEKLSECLSVVESRDNVEHIATILLPLIESLMVVCKHVGVKSTVAPAVPGSPRSPLPSEQSVDDLFVSFTDDHRKILNMMVRNNPSLMSGSFSLLVQNPRVLDFDNKRNYFNQQLHKRPYPREHYPSLQVNVRRSRVFEDSFHAFQHKTGDQIKYGKLSVRFYAEEGVDAGGVTREWFQILARQMFNPNYALFEPCAADRQTYQPNRASEINPDHLSYFKFVGRVIGKAIYDGRLMDAHFARSLYRMLLGKRVDYRDVEWVDPDYYKSLCWILENDPSMLDLNFITEVDEFGRHAVIPLKENGASIPVTMENRKEYVQLAAQYRLHSSIAKQIENLLAGFYEIVPKELISIFNEQEVELLISGTPDIDVDEWRAATEYHGYSSSDPVIVWWWRALKSFNRDERAKVLSFATGTTRVPLGGFGELQGVQGVQRFSIHRAYGEPDRLPQAHTCFNQIDLPEYSSYERLRHQLLLAINEGGEGFGFA